MRRRELTARLAEINRIGAETDRAEAALAAAVITQAMHDARHGERGTPSDPDEARAWLQTTGRRWLELLRPPEEMAHELSGTRIA